MVSPTNFLENIPLINPEPIKIFNPESKKTCDSLCDKITKIGVATLFYTIGGASIYWTWTSADVSPLWLKSVVTGLSVFFYGGLGTAFLNIECSSDNSPSSNSSSSASTKDDMPLF